MTTGRIDNSPDYKSKKKGVMFSQYTGGAYADAQEVIEDELARIQRSRAGYSADADRARLERNVIELVKKWATLRYQPHFGGMVALEDELQEATLALIELEQKHGIKQEGSA